METRRKILFKTRHEKFILFGVVGCVCAVYLFELFIILPKVHGPGFSSSLKAGHIVTGTAILISTLYSIWKFVTVDPGTGSAVLPSMKHGWKYCWRCEANFPPRSYHCYSCDKCALVRDHHCVIGANCVGYRTRRYFMHMNIYMWFALLYANFMNFDFVFELYHSLSAQSILTMVMPMLAWMMGLAQGETFLMAFMTSLCIVSFLYSTAIVLFHLRNTVKGRTTPEVAKKAGLMYDKGFGENMKHAFGVNWKIAWISPFIPSPLPSDGMSFEPEETLQKHVASNPMQQGEALTSSNGKSL